MTIGGYWLFFSGAMVAILLWLLMDTLLMDIGGY